MKNNIFISTFFLFTGLFGLQDCAAQTKPLKTEIQQSTPFTNPIMWADIPDLSVTRNGDDFYLISTTMHLMPGAPIMHSKDLVHWEM